MDTDYLSLGYVQQKEFREEVKQYLTEINKVGFESYMILLYGSVAQGTAHRKSDIDFLLVKEQWSKQEKDQVLEKIAIASNNCTHQAKPLFTTLEEFEDMDASLQKQIKEHGVILYEKDSQWGRIKRQLQRYRSITI